MANYFCIVAKKKKPFRLSMKSPGNKLGPNETLALIKFWLTLSGFGNEINLHQVNI